MTERNLYDEFLAYCIADTVNNGDGSEKPIEDSVEEQGESSV